MLSNQISGLMLSSFDSTTLLSFLYTILHKVDSALKASSSSPLLSQTQTTWEVLACKRPDAQAYSVTNAKKIIAADIVSMVEEFKKIKWEYVMNWPVSPFKESVWSILGHSLEMGTIYQIRNWCSHEFGIKESTLKQEQEKFETLIEHYKMLHPLVEELVEKLEAGLEDEAAWCGIIDFNDRRLACGAELPWYTKDCEAVQARLASEQERFRAMLEERDSRSEEEEVWVQVECMEDSGWAAQCGEGPQDGLSWGRTDNSDEGYEAEDDVSSVSDDEEDLAVAPMPVDGGEWAGYDSGYDDDAVPADEGVKAPSPPYHTRLWCAYRSLFENLLSRAAVT